jgi:integrase
MIVSLVQRAAGRATLRNNGPHVLRHTFVRILAMRGRQSGLFRNSRGIAI